MWRNIDIEHLSDLRELCGVNQQNLPGPVHLTVKNVMNILDRSCEDLTGKYLSGNLLQRERIDVADDVVSRGDQ